MAKISVDGPEDGVAGDGAERVEVRVVTHGDGPAAEMAILAGAPDLAGDGGEVVLGVPSVGEEDKMGLDVGDAADLIGGALLLEPAHGELEGAADGRVALGTDGQGGQDGLLKGREFLEHPKIAAHADGGYVDDGLWDVLVMKRLVKDLEGADHVREPLAPHAVRGVEDQDDGTVSLLT